MNKIKPIILPTVLSVLVLSMVISPTYPTLIPAYADDDEGPELTELQEECAEEEEDPKDIDPECELLNLITALMAKDMELMDKDMELMDEDVNLQNQIDSNDVDIAALDTRLTDLENDVQEAFDEVILYLTGVEVAAAIATVACAATVEPSCAVAFGAIAVLAAAAILVLEVIDFN